MKVKLILVLTFIVLAIISVVKCKEEEIDEINNNESYCEREGNTICQAICSPVGFKKCKKNLTSQNYDYCCICEFYEGKFKTVCVPVLEQES